MRARNNYAEVLSRGLCKRDYPKRIKGTAEIIVWFFPLGLSLRGLYNPETSLVILRANIGVYKASVRANG